MLQGVEVEIDGHRHSLPWFETAIYLCGPGDFCRSLKDGLVARGGNANTIYQELFSAPVAAATVDEARVAFAASALTARWTSAEDFTLLELAEQQGLDVPSSCRSGTCLTCRTAVIDGTTTADLGDGTCLPCIARPASPDLRLQI